MPSNPNRRPNILFILTDDHAAHAIGSYGSRINKTPHIDRIAREGMRFDNCFCTNSICEPSRAAILCGTYNHINGVTTIGSHLENDRDNVAKRLRKGGYETAIIGKWHLGEKKENQPRGFDYWKILPGQGDYFDPEFIRMDGSRERDSGYVTDLITDDTIEWISQRDKSKPFFLMCHHKAPHRWWLPDDKHKDMYRDETIPLPDTLHDDYSNRSNAAREAATRLSHHLKYRDIKCLPPQGFTDADFIPCPDNLDDFFLVPAETGNPVFFSSHGELLEWKYQRYIKDYLRCIASVDDNVGRLLDYLKANDLEDDTVVIYSSDQGFFLGDHGWFDKRFMYEESLRMPFLIRYPHEIAPGTSQKEIISNVDFAPLWLDYAGLEQPDAFQGDSFRSLARGIKPEFWKQSHYYRYWMHLAEHGVPAHYGIRTHQYKLIYYYGKSLDQPNTIDRDTAPEWELFDLKSDPKEMKNLYGSPEYSALADDLKEELHSWQDKVGDTREQEI